MQYLSANELTCLRLIAKDDWPCSMLTMTITSIQVAVNQLNKRKLIEYSDSGRHYIISVQGFELLLLREDGTVPFPMAQHVPRPYQGEDESGTDGDGGRA